MVISFISEATLISAFWITASVKGSIAIVLCLTEPEEA